MGKLTCPNCGRVYIDSNRTYCATCCYALIEDKKDIVARVEERINSHTINNTDSNPIVKCPYCNSTNTKKISTSSKVAHTAVFGIFSISRNSKQWHCNNCNSNF